MTADDRLPWDQQHGETVKAHHAFVHDVERGAGRSLDKALRQMNAAQRALATELCDRVNRGDPVTSEFLDRIPPGWRIEMPVTVTDADGTPHRVMVLIEDSVVTCHPAGEWRN